MNTNTVPYVSTFASSTQPKIQFWDAITNNDRKIFPVGSYSCVTIQIINTSTSAGTAPKFIIERSLDGKTWADVVPAVKMDAGSISGVIDCRATPFLSVRSDMTSGTVTSYIVDVLLCGDVYR